jgi:hypothetical protein
MHANINTLTFENNDTYVYYIDKILEKTQEVTLSPINPNNTDIVKYSSGETTLFSNCENKNNGIIKLNSFNNFSNNFGSTIGTIITNNGILMFNFATERNLSVTTTKQIKTLATYKSDKYANYINVEIQIDFEDTYRNVTISY